VTDRQLPREISRRARLILFACWTVSDDEGEVEAWGKPPSCMTTLMLCTDHEQGSVRHGLRELERAGLVKRRYEDKILRVKVLQEPPAQGVCESCGRKTMGTGRWCAVHKQTEGRIDRSWQVAALELHKLGYEPIRIATILRRPLLVASHDDGRNPNGGAVVPFLLSKGRLDDTWRERLREAENGALEDA
jgi:DNA-binding transcriptional ArsR family regulator